MYCRQVIDRRMGQKGQCGIPDQEDVPGTIGIREVRAGVGAQLHHLQPLLERRAHHHAQELLAAPELAEAGVLHDVDTAVALVEDGAELSVPRRAGLGGEAAVFGPVLDGGLALL